MGKDLNVSVFLDNNTQMAIRYLSLARVLKQKAATMTSSNNNTPPPIVP